MALRVSHGVRMGMRQRHRFPFLASFPSGYFREDFHSIPKADLARQLFHTTFKCRSKIGLLSTSLLSFSHSLNSFTHLASLSGGDFSLTVVPLRWLLSGFIHLFIFQFSFHIIPPFFSSVSFRGHMLSICQWHFSHIFFSHAAGWIEKPMHTADSMTLDDLKRCTTQVAYCISDNVDVNLPSADLIC